jgi:hypothetical protein
MSTGLLLWAGASATIIILAKSVCYLMKRRGQLSNSASLHETEIFISNVCSSLDLSFSFPTIVDSKLVGLAMFLVANLFTGVVNLSMTAGAASTQLALFILCLNSIVYTFIPFLLYYFYMLNRNKSKK